MDVVVSPGHQGKASTGGRPAPSVLPARAHSTPEEQLCPLLLSTTFEVGTIKLHLLILRQEEDGVSHHRGLSGTLGCQALHQHSVSVSQQPHTTYRPVKHTAKRSRKGAFANSEVSQFLRFKISIIQDIVAHRRQSPAIDINCAM